MKIKTNIRAGSGGSVNSGGTNAGGASGGGHNSTGEVQVEPVSPPPPVIYYAPGTRCAGL
ncbi:MAG TPA: hypothetical protein VIE16_02650 [Phenylobacterium sp.]|jgi:hypothetical protein